MPWRNRRWIVSRLQDRVAQPSGGGAYDGLSAADAETVASWVEAARDRGPVLFVGAGWTRNAVHGEQALLWTDLAAKFRAALEHDIGKDRTLDPLWLAELFRQRFGDDALVTLLRQSIPDQLLLPGALHHALSAIQWRAILTVNYDTLLERTFRPIQRVQVCVDDVDMVGSVARDAIELIHLHGVLERPDTIVLAFEEYRRYPEAHPGLLAKVRQLFLQHPVLFVGFGVTDPNFLQWAGWLSDVVGKSKNPWINLTLDPPPGVSLTRYWGTRLQHVSVPERDRFSAVVPEVLRVIGQAIDDKERSEDVALLRIRATASLGEVIQEVRDLLDTGVRSGAEGAEWNRFRVSVFNAAGSHALDLAGIDWREPTADQVEASRGLQIEIDLRPPTQRDSDDEIVTGLRKAFGDAWSGWRKLLSEHFTNPAVWPFQRVHLRKEALPDRWNSAWVPLDDASTTPPPPATAPTSTGSPTLDALRRGDPVAPADAPKTAQDFRLRGYLAYQRGEWREATEHYKDAAAASRAEGEPLRREWQTLRSLGASLDPLMLRGPVGDRERIGRELTAVRERLRAIRGNLALLPLDSNIEVLAEEEMEAERKVARLFVEDLDRDDVDGTVRMGDHYGSAALWLDRVEWVYLAPPLIADAADALGTLEWRFGDLAAAMLTLARYGSERLGIVVRATVNDPTGNPENLGALVTGVLRHGRWPGEWVSRAEALRALLPACTSEQIAEVGMFVRSARDALRAVPGGVARGGTTQRVESARAKVEDLEASRWGFLPPAQAFDAVVRWVDAIGDLPSITFIRLRGFSVLEQLPWDAWLASGEVTVASVEGLLVRLAEGRLAHPTREGIEDVEPPLEAILSILRAKVITAPLGSPLHQRVEQLIARLPSPGREAYVASLARIDGDDAKLSELVRAAAGRLAIAKNDDLRATLDTIAVVGDFADGLPTLLDRLDRIIDALGKELLKEPHPLQGRWNVLETGRLAANVIARLLRSPKVPDKGELTARAAGLLGVLPSMSEHLTTVPADVLGEVLTRVRAGVTELLAGGGPLSILSRRRQQFAGVRGVVRALVQLEAAFVPPEWLTQVCILAQAGDADLAAYAAWTLGEWASRRGAAVPDVAIAFAVTQALRAASLDARIRVRANGLRGLVLVERAAPSPDGQALIEAQRGDPRVAIQKALIGEGVT